ncbi:cobalamin-5'-phosphate synthase [Lachnospiraceae bacterium C7]|nr:cobalamin-5'-phosphate synthase [Lachnospiraceae bacterium C7]
MNIIKAFFISFSIYSQIPMPQFDWKEDDMKYTLCFFPLIGIVIGLVEIAWFILCQKFKVGNLCYSMIASAIPIGITGGFHFDGFMDTMDAKNSYQSQEKKLEILKDAHIGAFSVIKAILYFMVYIGAVSEVKNIKTIAVVAIGFGISRCLSGISVIKFKNAKTQGSLAYFNKSAEKRNVLISLIAQLIFYGFLQCYISLIQGIVVIAMVIVTFVYYYVFSKKVFNGITGDIAGYFVTVVELMILLSAVLMEHIV